MTRVSDNWTAAEWRDFELYYAGVVMKGNCRGSDIDAVNLAAGNAVAALNAGGDRG